ncbi:hypothetical protein HDU79_001857 [Rhizoclosmatium sp. JEL0117]|nr:hypothetical protein HDU79_001857 [Rhizoclosmatium sp. JEL0117]
MPEQNAIPTVTVTDTEPRRTIAIAIDSSKYSAHAFQFALDNYLKPTDYVALINVQQYQSTVHKARSPPADTATPMEESYDILEKYSKILKAKHYEYKEVFIHPNEISVKESVVRAVATLKADALIIGSRGEAASRSALGSVSDYCAHYCQCPVLIARPNEEDSEAGPTTA